MGIGLMFGVLEDIVKEEIIGHEFCDLFDKICLM